MSEGLPIEERKELIHEIFSGMNDGKQLEKLVRLVQETFKNVSETEIYSRYRIPNLSGRNREIDVYIETIVNGAQIKIAIECKDYKHPIPVKEIEAFYGKCKRIKGITKKIFVSSNGFQADAKNAAKDFNISLYEFQNVTIDVVQSWLPHVNQAKPSFLLLPSFGLHFEGDESNLPVLDPEQEVTIYCKEFVLGTPLSDFILSCIGNKERNMLMVY